MRILVLADVHSNWPALAAIDESFDVCLFAGDLVDYGTDPVPCIDWMRDHNARCVRGNHDHAVAQRIPARGGSGFHALAAATRPCHWEQLDALRMKYLARMPVTRHLSVAGLTFFLVHGTPRDPMDEYLTDDSQGWAQRLTTVSSDFVLVGHTHVPFQLELGGTTVLNPGSVGQPRDGDPRCSYAIIENGRVEIRRREYDVDATIQHMRDQGVGGTALDVAEQCLREGGLRID